MEGLVTGGVPASPVRLSGLGEERVWKPHPLKRVTILGMGPSGMDWISSGYDQHHRHTDPGDEIWAINAAAFVYRHHVSFNIHDFTWNGGAPDTAADHRRYVKIYKDHPLPVVTVRALEELPCTLEYPMTEVVEEFKSSYFANSVTYAIAAAILCGVEEIQLLGCDYNYKTQERQNPYEHGRCNVEYFMGIAHARGIKIGVAPRSYLMDTLPRLTRQQDLFYGYGPAQPELEIMDDGRWRVHAFVQQQASSGEVAEMQKRIDENAKGELTAERT